MNKWMLKAALQGIISLLPGSARWNFFFQKYVSKNMDLKVLRDRNRIGWAARYLANYQGYGASQVGPSTVLELGTGWFPFVPIGMYLCGVDRIMTIDITPLIRREILIKTLHFFDLSIRDGQIEAMLPGLLPERAAHLQEVTQKSDTLDIHQILESLNIEQVIGDARACRWQDQSIDFFVSNTTLEHISAPIMTAIFQEFRRLAKPGAIMSHLIDLSDHYSHFDSGITYLNFLQYGERRWRWFNNAMHYQNRLRINDYREIHRRTGFEILDEENISGSPSALQTLNLAPQFAGIPPEELIVRESWMVSRVQGD